MFIRYLIMLGSRTSVNVYTKMMECKASSAEIKGGDDSPKISKYAYGKAQDGSQKAFSLVTILC